MIRYRRLTDTIYIQWQSPNDTTCKYSIEWGTYDQDGKKVPNKAKRSTQYKTTHTTVFQSLVPYTRYWFSGQYIESTEEKVFESFSVDITTLSTASVNITGDIYENNIVIDIASSASMDLAILLDDTRVVARKKEKSTSHHIVVDGLNPLTEYKILLVMRGIEDLYEATYVFTTRQAVDQAIQSDELFKHTVDTIRVININSNKGISAFTNMIKASLRAATLSDYEASADQLTKDQMTFILDIFVTYAMESGGIIEQYIQDIFNWLKYRNIDGEPLTSSQKIAIFAVVKEVADNQRLSYESNTISTAIQTLNQVGLVGDVSALRDVYNTINPTPLPPPSSINFENYTEPKIASIPTDYTYGEFSENLTRDYTLKEISIVRPSGIKEPPLTPPSGLGGGAIGGFGGR